MFPFFSWFTYHDYTPPNSQGPTIQFGKNPARDVECSRESVLMKEGVLNAEIKGWRWCDRSGWD